MHTQISVVSHVIVLITWALSALTRPIIEAIIKQTQCTLYYTILLDYAMQDAHQSTLTWPKYNRHEYGELPPIESGSYKLQNKYPFNAHIKVLHFWDSMNGF